MEKRKTRPDYKVYLARRTFEPSGEPFIPPSDEPKYYLVQFTRQLTEEERERLKQQYNLRFSYYIPNFAFLERITTEQWSALSQNELYRASTPYRPSDKISPEIEPDEDELQPGGEGIRLRALLFSEATDEAIAKIIRVIESLGAKTAEDAETARTYSERDPIERLDDRQMGGHYQLIFTLPSTEGLLQLAEIQEIKWIEKVTRLKTDACPQANLVAGTIQSGTPGVTPVWDQGIDGRDQIIGMIDVSLINLEHCMFQDEPSIQIGSDHRKMVGVRRGTSQLNAHATVVASVAAGDEISNSGLSNSRGIAWRARLSYDDLTIISGNVKSLLEVLTDEFLDGARVHTNSWHDDTRFYNNTAFNVDSFVWLNEMSFVCGSTANSGQGEKLGPPGTAKNALCVSAGRRHPNHTRHGDGKSGPTPAPDRRRKPEICAPGCGINAATTDPGCLCSIPPNGCATSWATPVIAGAAALVRQYYLEGFHRAGVQDLSQSHTPTGALVKATLLNSTVLMESAAVYPNGNTGWGLVKLDNTLFFAGGARRLFVEDVLNADGLEAGQSRAHDITVTSPDQPLKITLVWSDPPGQVFAGKALVHDLNLIVTSPGGTDVYLGNVNFVNGFSTPRTPTSTPDANNNVEMVIVRDPEPGLWTITVECVEANLGKQGYALVATGALA
jgi:Subtilase family